MVVSLILAAAMCVSSLLLAHRSALRQTTAGLNALASSRESALLAWNGRVQSEMGVVLPQAQVDTLALDLLTSRPDDPMRPHRQAQFSSLLARADEASGLFDELSLLDSGGAVLASSRPDPEPGAVAVPVALLTGQRAPATVLAPPAPGDDAPRALVIRPVRDRSGRQAGSLAGRARAAGVADILAQGDTLEGVQIFLTGDDMRLLVPPNPAGELEAGMVVNSIGSNLARLSHQSGDARYFNPFGLEVVGVWRPVPSLGATLFLEQEMSQALRPMRDASWTVLGAAAAMVLLASLAAGPLAAYLSTPLRGVAEAARRIARGDLHVRAVVQGQAEVRLLAKSFNDMAGRLGWRIEAENLLGAMAKGLLAAPRGRLDRAADKALGDLCRFLRAQCAVLAIFEAGEAPQAACRWPAAGESTGGEARIALLLARSAEFTRERSVVLLPAASPDEAAPGTCGLCFAVFAPVLKENSPWGTLCLESDRQTPFDQDEAALLERAAEILGMAVERARAEADRAASESKYRHLFENAVEAIVQTTPWGRVLDANPAAARLFGYASPAAFMAGVKDLGMQHYAQPEVRRELLRVLHDRGEVKGFELLFLDTHGRRIWGELSAQGVYDASGTLERVDSRVDDITGRKAAEAQRDRYVAALAAKNEALARTKGFISDIFDSMPSFVVSLDASGAVAEINREALRVAGVDRKQALGRFFPELFPFLGDVLEDFRRAADSATLQVRRKVLHGSDGTHHLDVVVFPLTHGEGGAVVRVDDVSERVRIEEMMVQTEKMLSVGGLAAGMAHEINNPLAGILHSAQVIGRRLSLGLEANRRAAAQAGCDMESVRRYLELRGVPEFLGNIEEAGRRAARIVSNMLEFSRQSASQLTPHDLRQVIDQALELASSDYNLSRKFDFKHIAIERDYDPDLPPAPCSPSQIQQVLLNILGNAAQAMASRDTSRPAPRIAVRARRQNGSACIEIADNGPGMTDETRRRVFEPFFTTKPVGMGTGLGLSVSYFIVTRTHGGNLSVESSPGAGAVFRISLPLQR